MRSWTRGRFRSRAVSEQPSGRRTGTRVAMPAQMQPLSASVGSPSAAALYSVGRTWIRGRGDVRGGTRLDIGDPQRGAVRCGQELNVAAEALVLLGEPQVVVVLPDPCRPVAGDQRAVQHHVCHSPGTAEVQRLVQIRSLGGGHTDTLMEVAAAGGLRDPGVPGQAVHAAVCLEPAQHQYRLAERAQGARALRCADLAPVCGRQPGEELHDVVWDVERGGMGDQREASDWSGPDLGRPVLPGASRLPGLMAHPEVISLAKPG